MANPLDDIQTLLNAMRDRGAEMETFRELLANISQSLADAVACMEKPEAPEPPDPKDAELLALLQRLAIPAPTVKVETKAPIINVQPSVVQMMHQPAATITGTFVFNENTGRPVGFTLTRAATEQLRA